MRYIILTIAALLLSSCATFQNVQLPGTAPDCSSNMVIDGTSRIHSSEKISDTACHELKEAVNHERQDKGLDEVSFDRVPPVAVRVYGAGDKPQVCGDYRSGTCTAKMDTGGYVIEIRRPTFKERTEGGCCVRSVSAKLRHEMHHVALFELLPMVGPQEHHRRLLSLGLCAGSCDELSHLDFGPEVEFGD